MRRSICLVLLCLTGCGSRSNGPTAPTSSSLTSGLGSTFSFVRSPMDPAFVEFITPLGNLNPPGHTLPTDHIYFYHHLNHRTAPQYDVFAPADGVVAVVQRGNDDQIMFWSSTTQMYYLGHVILDSGFAQGQKITAGQHLGTTSPLSFGLDLGVINYAVTFPFIVPGRYSDNSLHADAPLKFFTEPLKSQLYAMVEGTGVNRDGQIFFDQPGRLSGGWFHESLPVVESAGPTGWTRHLAFVHDNRDPRVILISIGGTITTAGTYAIGANDPDPASVTTASGPVTFHIVSTSFGGPTGPLTVTMLSDTRIRVQFDGNELNYVR